MNNMIPVNITDNDKHLISEFKNVMLLLLTTIDLIFIFLSTAYSFNFTIDNYFADYDLLVCILLFIDLSYEYYSGNRSLKQFLIDDKNIISLISLFPFDMLFRYFSIFRIFRFLKLIKLIRIWNIQKDLGSLEYFIQHHLFRLLFIVFMCYLAISSVLLIIFDEAFSNLGEAIWFLIITSTTVGYGDIVPSSPIGKSLSTLTILMGIIFVAIITAYLSGVYNEKTVMETRETLESRIRELNDTNKEFKDEIKILNNKLHDIEEENIFLHKQLDENYQKLDEILKKL